jgi:hypothetical protein
MLDFRVTQEFQVMGLVFVVLSPGGHIADNRADRRPADGSRASPPDDVQDLMKLPGLHHLCLQVEDIDTCMRI